MTRFQKLPISNALHETAVLRRNGIFLEKGFTEIPATTTPAGAPGAPLRRGWRGGTPAALQARGSPGAPATPGRTQAARPAPKERRAGGGAAPGFSSALIHSLIHSFPEAVLRDARRKGGVPGDRPGWVRPLRLPQGKREKEKKKRGPSRAAAGSGGLGPGPGGAASGRK